MPCTASRRRAGRALQQTTQTCLICVIVAYCRHAHDQCRTRHALRSMPQTSRQGTRAGSVAAGHKASPETRRGWRQGFPADEITQTGVAGAEDHHVAGAGRAPACARLPAHRVNQGMILLRTLERQVQRLLWRKARVGEGGGQVVSMGPARGLYACQMLTGRVGDMINADDMVQLCHRSVLTFLIRDYNEYS